MSEPKPSDGNGRAASSPKNLFRSVSCSPAAIGAALARKEFGSFFPPRKKVPSSGKDASKKHMEELSAEVRRAMSRLLHLITRKTKGNLPSEQAIKAAEQDYETALQKLLSITPSVSLKHIEKTALLRELPREQEQYALDLAEFYARLKQSMDEGINISLNWDFFGMDYLVSRGFEAPDAARILIGSKKTIHDVFNELKDREKELVMAVVGRNGPCAVADLQEFVSMPPGIRELKIRNFVASLWTAAPWGFGSGEGTENRQVRMLSASFEEYKEAAKSLYSHCGLSPASEADKLDAVLKTDLLTQYQRYLVSAFLGIEEATLAQSHIFEFDRKVAQLDPKRRAELCAGLWKLGRQDILTLASITHKMAFNKSAVEASPEEARLIKLVFGKQDVSDDDLSDLQDALVQKTFGDDEDRHFYKPLLMAAYDNMPLRGCTAILHAARAEAEVAVLLEFIGFPPERIKAKLDYSHGASHARLQKDGSAGENQDRFSSAVVRREDGRKILLDAVFDGMGGHNNGALASSICKSVFEISALAGWIKEPEDLRRVLILADLTITMEQIRMKTGLETPRQENNMGAAAVITMQCGPNFFGAHVGDAEYRIYREGRVVLATIPHNVQNNPNADEFLRREQGANLTSALGSATPHIHINNRGLDSGPFILEDDDVRVAASDGFMKSICDHEVELALEKTGGDLAKAHELLMELAVKRRNGAPYSTLCGCGVIKGVKDDKTSIFHLAKEANSEGEL